MKEQTNYSGQLLNDHLGLIIYDDPQGTCFVQVGPATLIAGTPVSRFVESLGSHISDEALDDKHLLALELYSAAHFESSLRARFLTLISVIEVLSTKRPRPNDARLLVDSWIEQLTDSFLAQEHKESLRSAVTKLRMESIGFACRHLVGTLAGSEEAEFFQDCYAARSKLLHTGSPTYDLRAQVSRLEQVVRTTLLRYSPG